MSRPPTKMIPLVWAPLAVTGPWAPEGLATPVYTTVDKQHDERIVKLNSIDRGYRGYRNVLHGNTLARHAVKI